MRGPEDSLKKQLRREVLARRAALSEEEIAGKSVIIATRVIQSWEYQQAGNVLLYASFDHEVRTQELIEATLRLSKRVILPRVSRETRWLETYFVEDPQEQLAPGTWGILEPVPERCRAAELGDIDCILAPGVGFDIYGGRLGYGGGYYDRLLNSLTPWQARLAVGLCFEAQLVREVPRGIFDANVSVVCTEVNLIDNR